jgi:hypothetical protein
MSKSSLPQNMHECNLYLSGTISRAGEHSFFRMLHDIDRFRFRTSFYAAPSDVPCFSAESDEQTVLSRSREVLMSEINEALRQELLAMQSRDQELRQVLSAGHGAGTPVEQAELEQIMHVDKVHTARMQEIIQRFGWPGRSLVDEDGAQAAWLLLQHADQVPEFQKQCLELLQTAVLANEASPAHLAYLTDRVRCHEGKPQVYGTQGQITNGEVSIGEIEDRDHVDERRAEVGLEPLADYLANLKRFYQK